MLHKNGQARNNNLTQYLIIQPYCLQKNDQDYVSKIQQAIAVSFSRHNIQHLKRPNYWGSGNAETLVRIDR